MLLEHWMLITLALLFIKHWYVDFVVQTMEEVNTKGKYLAWPGTWHSIKHGIATFLVFFIMGESPEGAIILAMVDLVTHYHIDWAKMNYGNRDIQTPQFWSHLGLDQLAHYLVYLLLVFAVVSNVQ
jgi:hypothetical protein